MDKPFQTFRQQIRILRSRNLEVNGSRAMRILRRENYYNIVNGYKEIFLDSSFPTEMYKDGTSFDDLYALYSFDRNLRSILLKYILRMETSVKTKIAYVFSEDYPENFSYFNINNFRDDIQRTTQLISYISADIKNNTEPVRPGRSVTPFSHYLSVHKELPLWVLIKKMTLGETSHFYLAMKDIQQQRVFDAVMDEYRREYKLKALPPIPDEHLFFLGNMIRLIVEFRNICAHEERLYDHVSRLPNGKLSKVSYFYMEHPAPFNAKIIDAIFILGLFIMKKDYQQLVKELSHEIDLLSSELDSRILNQILIRMGFPKDWKEILKYPR